MTGPSSDFGPIRPLPMTDFLQDIARFQPAFWKRNWWQVVFLLVPFLRLLRALGGLRGVNLAGVGRAGSLTSASVRVTRSAVRLLSTRAAIFVAAILSRSPRGRKRSDDGT